VNTNAATEAASARASHTKLVATLLAALILSATVLVASRFRGLSDPAILAYDESLYLVQGMAWAQGQLPGRDTWVNKPPLLTLVFAANYRLFGASTLFPRVLEVLALLGSAAVAVALVREKGTLAPLVAALAVAVVGSTRLPAADLVPALSEPLYDLPLALALLVALRWRPGLAASALAGGLLGAATLTRQNGLLFVPLVALVCALREPGAWRRTIPTRGALFALGAFLPFVPFLLYFHAHGALAELYGATWTGPKSVHIMDPGRLWARALVYLGEFFSSHVLLTALAAIGLGAAARAVRLRRSPLEHGALVLFLVTSACSCVAGGRFYAHYLPMMAPAMGALAGLGVAALEEVAGRLPAAARTTALALLAGACALDAAVATREQMDRNASLVGSEITAAAEHGPLLERVRELTGPGERIFFVGSCPGIYFRSERSPAVADLAGEAMFFCRFLPGYRLRKVRLPDGGEETIEDYFARKLEGASLVLVPIMPPKGSRWFSGQCAEQWNLDANVPQLATVARALAERFHLLETVESVQIYVPTSR
jgi:hypothetical protein